VLKAFFSVDLQGDTFGLCRQPGAESMTHYLASTRGALSHMQRGQTAGSVEAGGEGAQRSQPVPDLLMAMGPTPMWGFARGMMRASRGRGRSGSLPCTKAWTQRSTTERASSLLEVAALICSYVQPLQPAADPLGTAFNTVARISSVIVAGGSSGVGTGGGSSWG
jgi:hypothetical protein